MPIRSHFSQAVRMNGFTDGLVVPTGAYKESGVDMFSSEHPEKTGVTNKTQSYNSNQTKIGLQHIPNEGNMLNNMIGSFTIEAYIIPDMGGVVVHKPNCYTLRVGDVRSRDRATFDVHTLNPSGKEASQRVSSTTLYPMGAVSSTGTYQSMPTEFLDIASSEIKQHYHPEDLSLPSRELLYVNAQFTGKRMRVFINMDLVAEMDFGGEDRIVRSFSSDVFIGGMGGEFRGVIESVRISRGIIEPMLRPFTSSPETAGLWNFEDEIEIPDLHFFNNKNPLHSNTGKDGAIRDNNDALMPLPMVCLGYDFNSISPSSATVAGAADPITLADGNEYGWFRIRDFPNAGKDKRPTAYEQLAAYLLNIPVEELPKQAWYESGILDLSTYLTKASYHSDGLVVSPLNAVINTSGTSPVTGLTKNPFTATHIPSTDDMYVAGGSNMNPMSNPIERVRIVAIDFKGGWAIGDGQYQPDYSAGSVDSGAVNRPPCVVIQSTLLKSNPAKGGVSNDPKSQGFLFKHPDDTPVWFVLGNGDLMIDKGTEETDSGVANQVTRPRGQYTRARFTQSQRFTDVSGNGNDAYWFAPKSRLKDGMFFDVQPSQSLADTPPFYDDLALWYDSSDITTLYDFEGKNIKYEGQVVFWWRNKALTTSLTAPNNHCLFGWGDGWEWKQVCSGVRGRSGLRAMTPSIYQTVGPNTFPAGNPVIAAPTVAPQYPTGIFHWGGSCWVNGTTNRIPSVAGLTPQPFNADAAGTSHVTALNSNPTIDGNWTYYYVITTPSGYTSPIALLHSEGNQNIDIRINVGGGISFDIDGIGSAATGSSILNPDPNSPSILSIRIDESNSKIIWGLYRSGESVRRSQQDLTGYTSANPLIFDDLGVATAGFDLFGRVVSSNPTTRTITELAPPNFIVHEIMCYPTLLNDNQDHNVLQWLENKYGIDV